MLVSMGYCSDWLAETESAWASDERLTDVEVFELEIADFDVDADDSGSSHL